MKDNYEICPALFLDLDGTVRYSKNGKFINGPEDVALYEGVEDEIWKWRDDGYLILGITNQGGVAFGYKTPQDYEKETNKMLSLFERNPFHFIAKCFHHPDGTVEPYRHRSLLRKPSIGMVALCEVEMWRIGYVISLDHSLMVGDMESDRECAQNAGVDFRWAWEFFARSKETK